MDEPTAALSGVEVERLFTVARRLRDEGRALVFISHRFDEVFSLCDTVSVMRDGDYIATKRVADTNVDEIVELMVGREVSDLFPKTPAQVGAVVLQIDGLPSAGVCHAVPFQAVPFHAGPFQPAAPEPPVPRSDELGVVEGAAAPRGRTQFRRFQVDCDQAAALDAVAQGTSPLAAGVWMRFTAGAVLAAYTSSWP